MKVELARHKLTIDVKVTATKVTEARTRTTVPMPPQHWRRKEEGGEIITKKRKGEKVQGAGRKGGKWKRKRKKN